MTDTRMTEERMACTAQIVPEGVEVTCHPLVEGVTPEELYSHERKLGLEIGEAWVKLLNTFGAGAKVTTLTTIFDHEGGATE